MGECLTGVLALYCAWRGRRQDCKRRSGCVPGTGGGALPGVPLEVAEGVQRPQVGDEGVTQMPPTQYERQVGPRAVGLCLLKRTLEVLLATALQIAYAGMREGEEGGRGFPRVSWSLVAGWHGRDTPRGATCDAVRWLACNRCQLVCNPLQLACNPCWLACD